MNPKIIEAIEKAEEVLETVIGFGIGISNNKWEKYKELIDIYDSGNIPEVFPKPSNDFNSVNSYIEHEAKSILQNCCGIFCTVDLNWTKHLANWLGNRKVLEIQCGKGYLAKALKQYGIDIIATDDFSYWNINSFIIDDAIQMDRVEAIERFEKDVDILLLSWPRFDDLALVKDLMLWPEDKPIIYIGEGSSGCCACPEFFEYYEHERLEKVNKHYNSWSSIYDRIYVGYWKTKGKDYDYIMKKFHYHEED